MIAIKKKRPQGAGTVYFASGKWIALEVVKLVAAIEENRRTLQWKNHDEDVIMLSDSTNNDWARISRTAWGWRMFVFEMPIGMNRRKFDAMCRVGEIMRTMGILRPFDVVKGIGE